VVNVASHVAYPPPWLTRLLTPPSAPAPVVGFPYGVSTRSDAGLVRVVANAAEGNRNHALHWAACRAHERGSNPALLTTLVDAAIHAPNPRTRTRPRRQENRTQAEILDEATVRQYEQLRDKR
jgi:hypothetical protein